MIADARKWKDLERVNVGVYIDGANIYHGGRNAGWHVDYEKLKSFIERRYDISIISFYDSIGYERDEERNYLKDGQGEYIQSEKALKFHNHLRGSGIRVITKPLKFISGDESKPSNKMDGDLTVEVMVEHPQWDELLLFSGDCDFERLVKHVSDLPKKVRVFSFDSRISHELKVMALESPSVTFTKLDDLKSLLEKTY